jgi:hypothetical protein
MSWRTANIKPGELYKAHKTHYNVEDFAPIRAGSIALIIDLETIAGNVFYLIEDKKYRMDASSLLGFYQRITT